MPKHRALSLFICLLFSAVTVIPPAQGAAAASALVDFTVQWSGEAPSLTAVAGWSYEGEQYEMAVTGIKSRLSDSLLEQTAADFHDKKNVALTNTALTDAEKFSHLVPQEAGAADTWVVMDEVRSSEFLWGDSLQCWAASAAVMLASSGWSAKAVNPATGAAFADEDEVFSYFTKNYPNDGGLQEEGITMFFTGKQTEGGGENASPLLPGENPKKYLRVLSVEDEANGLKILTEMIPEIKKGAALGISINMCAREYPLLSDPMQYAEIENGRYVQAIYEDFDEEEYAALPESYWCFDESGNVRLVTKDGDTYKDADGNIVPAMCVKKDHLWPDEVTGAYYIPVPESSGFSYTACKKVIREEQELDIAHPVIYRGLGNGNHAVTAEGYIRNLTQASGKDGGIRALFIANSDNDADIWLVTDSTVKKEDRPNTYTLCYTEVQVVEAGGEKIPTLKMTNYMEDGEAIIARACLLYPKGAAPGPEPVPETGDDTPIALWAALLAGAGLCLALLRKKAMAA